MQDDIDALDLEATSEEWLVHRARRMRQTSHTSWASPARETRALLSPATEGGENIRTDQVSAAVAWLLQLPGGSPGAGGDRFQVTGKLAGKPFSRTVQVVRTLSPRPVEIRRRLLCMDVSANPDLG